MTKQARACALVLQADALPASLRNATRAPQDGMAPGADPVVDRHHVLVVEVFRAENPVRLCIASCGSRLLVNGPALERSDTSIGGTR